MRQILAVLLFACIMCGQARTAKIEGSVRDNKGQPAANVLLSLRETVSGRTVTTRTDQHGAYRFLSPPGTYLLEAQAADGGEATLGPFGLASSQTKKVRLTLRYALPDEPKFIVAGVTDPMSRGGHGSDEVPRSAEDIAKATAELGNGASGDALETVKALERAAGADPSEPNLFNWGAELLQHRAAEPAAQVFGKGHRLFPQSLRMLLGLAAAWYALSQYDRAATYFFAACDLEPDNPRPYRFLGKIQSPEITGMEGYVERLQRFAEQRPTDAWADYYYAVALWKRRKGPEDTATPGRVRELLEKSSKLDPRLAEAYLYLGIVYTDDNDAPRAITAFQEAIEINPGLAEAHYRLGLVYARGGQKEKARLELERYQDLLRKSAEDVERERREMQQFVYQLR